MTMSPHELEILHKHMKQATRYLEFGSGESTVYASQLANITRIDSIESSGDFIDQVLRPKIEIQQAVQSGKLHFHTIDIGNTREWGYPSDESKKHLWPNYSSAIFRTPSHHNLVLIDGRFRVACTLNAILHTPGFCKILIHDFWNRPQYHVVLNYLDTIEQADTLGVFIKRKSINLKRLKSELEKYKILADDKTISFRIREKIKKRRNSIKNRLGALRAKCS